MKVRATKLTEKETQPGSRLRSNVASSKPDLFPFRLASTVLLQRKINCACGGGCPGCEQQSDNIKLQTKLAISSPGDPYEREADQVADQVMRMSDPVLRRQSKSSTDASTLRNDEGLQINRQQNGAGGSGDVASDFTSGLGSGLPLDTTSRAYFESRFGHDFGSVRIHDGPEAATAAASIQARAFTLGRDVVFAAGEHDPGSEGGKRLLAHELTHVVQQSGLGGSQAGRKRGLFPVSLQVENSSLQPMMIQRVFAVPPTAPGAVPVVLTAAQMRRALSWNQAAFSDADEISLLRDVLEISAAAVIDEDFVRGLVHYQAIFGLTQDGLLGAGTAGHLADELHAKAGLAGATPDVATGTEMALNPAERRMRLRSRVVSRLGRMLHQGFIGPRDNPTGVVTVRSGFTDPAVAERNNRIGINYTGSNADNSRWLQFGFQQMSAINPATRRREYQTGAVGTTAGAETYSDATTFHWNVDAVPAAGNMYYEGSGTNERVGGSYTEIFDQPRRWNGEAETYAASFATRPANVRLIIGFDTYLVVNNNRVVYHVRWNMYFNFNTSVSPTLDVPGSYEVLTAGAASRLPTALKARLDAQYAGNTVP